MGNANICLDSEIRSPKAKKAVHAQVNSGAYFTTGEPALIYPDKDGVLTAMNYIIASEAKGTALIGICAGGTSFSGTTPVIASKTFGTFLVKGEAPLISWATKNSGILIVAMDASGTVTDSAAVSSATLRGFHIGITTGASGIILW
jgi:hypothetical protein